MLNNSWRKDLYGPMASDKRYSILVAPDGSFTSVPVGGKPIYPYEKDWREIVRVNRPLPVHYSEGAYRALLRVCSF